MKKLWAVILVSCVMVQGLSFWIVILEFQLNRNYVAKELCVNRSRPKLKCGGKCQLMKGLLAAEKGAGQSDTKPEHIDFPVYYSVQTFTILPVSSSLVNTIVSDRYLEHTYEEPVFPILHPPLTCTSHI